MAVKLLFCGVERTGKSTTTSKIKDGLVFSFDSKVYPFKTPSKDINEYHGMSWLEDTMNDTISAYEDRYGSLPKTIVMDTVTQLYNMIAKFSMDKFSGFDIHSNINKETLAFNSYIEDVLIANGVNVVIVAHTLYDSDTYRYIIPATGNFAKTGSWLSIVDNSSFVHIKNGSKFVIEHTNMKFPCRTTLEDIPDSQPIEEYDINEHIYKLSKVHTENEEFKF